MVRAFLWAIASSPVLVIVLLAGACSTSSSSSTDDGGTTGGGMCPCVVGNSGLHFTLPCGGAQCVTLNGTATGYRCGQNGATVDPAVCEPGFDAGSGGLDAGHGGFDAGPPCMPKSCADQGFTCGTVPDMCGGMVVCPACGASEYCSETDHCLSRAQNVVIYGNLQGGTFGIEVDKHIPNLGIGLVSNSVMNVTFSGAYVSDIVAVYMAVNQGPGTVTGIPQSLVVWHRVPPATVDAGFSHMVLDCETPPSQMSFGCNPPAQVQDFFVKTLGGTLLFNDCQMAPFTGTMLVSAAGTCM